jgi:hypothetical protein
MLMKVRYYNVKGEKGGGEKLIVTHLTLRGSRKGSLAALHKIVILSDKGVYLKLTMDKGKFQTLLNRGVT